MNELEMDMLIAQQRDRINELQRINGEMREYIAKHTQLDNAARTVQDTINNLGVTIISAEYYFALDRLHKAVAASAGFPNGAGAKFETELAELERHRGRP